VYGLPPCGDDERAATVAELARHGRVLILSQFTEGLGVTDMLRLGASGCVSDDAADEDLLHAVDEVGHGDLHISPAVASRVRSELRRPVVNARRPLLGRREMETLRLLAAGLTDAQIAQRMGLAEVTVTTYVKRIRRKLNVGARTSLLQTVTERGLLE